MQKTRQKLGACKTTTGSLTVGGNALEESTRVLHPVEAAYWVQHIMKGYEGREKRATWVCLYGTEGSA